MELRRALLLFAIVLGVAAIVASLAGPSTRRSEPTTTTPPPAGTERAGSGRPPVRVRVDGRGAPATRALSVGRAATVIVSVDEPGEVELAGLGLTDAAEPRAPAVFDTFPARPGRHEVLFTPAGGVRPRALGLLVSRPRK